MPDYKSLIALPCPWCGEGLVIRKGRYGEFVACAEWCGYTKSIEGRSDYPSYSKKQSICKYGKCNGSGLLPFIKTGRIIPFVSIHCECYHDKTQEHYQDLTPDCFDFPVSSTFRGASFDYCGNKDPAQYNIREVKSETVIIKQKTDLQPIYAQLSWFKTKLLEKQPKKIVNKGLYDSV